jgi:hypothetical protein
LTFGIILIALAFSCHKGGGSNTPQCKDFEEPNGIIFEIKMNGVYDTDSTFLGQVKMAYYNGNTKQYVSDFALSQGFTTSDGKRHFVFSTINAQLSSTYGTKNFYLEYPDGSTEDTIYLNEVRSPATNCEYVMEGLLINRARPMTDSLFVDGGDSTYIVNHR